MDSDNSLLIADELGLVRDGIAQICHTVGWARSIHTACDAESTLEVVRSQRPGVALIDFQLPGVFSLELVRQLREMGAGARIVIMAARGDRKLALETLRAGANGFLLKNCMASELIEALNRVH